MSLSSGHYRRRRHTGLPGHDWVKQSVKANWAALVGGGKVHWLGRKRIRLDGMKELVKIQATLPCGWADHILIHKQASLKEMNLEHALLPAG